MELNLKQKISNDINTSLKNIPEYNPFNFVEDSLQINNILKSELRNQSDFKLCLNKLRAILKSNKPLFCSLFTNLISSYLSILKSENIVPEEYMFVLVDILHNKSEFEKYFKKWVEPILLSLFKFYATYISSKDNEQINKICSYIEFWIDEFISIDENSINYLMFLFEQTNVEIQKMSAFFFFKYIYRYDINNLQKIDWKYFFGTCADILDSKYKDDENKNVVNDIFKQILIYFNKLNVDPNDALINGESLTSAKYFQTITGFNTEKAKQKLRD
jgi:hypothetical protein